MRPYLAILKDSFREALASPALWILLVLTTFILLFAAPLGYRETITIGLREGAVQEWPELIDRIRTEGVNPQPSPSRRIWTLLDAETREKMEHFAMPKEGDMSSAMEFSKTLRAISNALDRMARRPDFYDEKSWEKTQFISPEARQLKNDFEQLSADEKSRFNRLLLEAAYPDLIRISPPTSVVFTYLVWDASAPRPLRPGGLAAQIESWIALVMKVFVGTIGVFAAVLATAPIIPRIFEPGSLNLLLSKPISRWLLFMTKYIGGCAFILICASYLIGGMWLILGLRFGIWNVPLLLGIPVYAFVFSVYYAVSAFAGLVSRSTVVSIAVTICFWLICFLVGTIKVNIERSLLNRTQIVKLMQAKETLISVNAMGQSNEWDESAHEWKKVFVSEDQKQLGPMIYMMPLALLVPVAGPLYDSAGDRLLEIHRTMRTRKAMLTVGKRSEQWEGKTGADPPSGTFALLREPDDDVLAVSSVGIHRLVSDPLASSQPMKILGMEVPFTGSSPFDSVGPEPPVVLTQPAAAAVNRDTGALAVYSRGVVTLLSEDKQGKYERRRERKLEDDERLAAVMAFASAVLVVGRSDGRILILDGDTLEERKQFCQENDVPPRSIAAAPQGRRFAVVFHNGRLWLLDADSDTLSPAKVAGQGDISAAALPDPDRLLVADRSTRVSEYQLATGKLLRRYAPKLGLLQWTYLYGITPLYTVFPKQRELDKTIEWLLSGGKTAAPNGASEDLDAPRETLHPWAPVWSSLVFAAIVLAASCVYIECREF